MHPSQLLSRVAAAAALTVAATASQAALTTYSSSASFASATTAAATDTFDDLVLGEISSPLTRAVGPYGYTASAPSGLFGAGVPSDIWLGLNKSEDTLTINNFTGGVRAIGGLFFATDADSGFLAGQTLTITATDSLGATVKIDLFDSSLTSFLGFVSTGTITSLTISAATLADESFSTMNNLVLAQVPTPPVPEPATYGMLLAGLGALAFVRRRRNG